jgi:hypothetical protein
VGAWGWAEARAMKRTCRPLVAPAAGAQLKTYKMRTVAHVLQKDANVEEATPILRNKFSTGITGLF